MIELFVGYQDFHGAIGLQRVCSGHGRTISTRPICLCKTLSFIYKYACTAQRSPELKYKMKMKTFTDMTNFFDSL